MRTLVAICTVFAAAAACGEIKFTPINVKGVELVSGVTHPEFRTATNQLWGAVSNIPNIADNRITNSVQSGYLCTVEAAEAMTNGLMRASDYHGDYITDGINTINANREVFEYLCYVITNGVTVLLYKHEPPSFGTIAEYRSADYDGVTKGVVFYNDDLGGGICSPVLTPEYWPPSGSCYICFPGETHTLKGITVTISADMYAEPPYRTVGKLATTNDIPTALKNPHALTFTGAASGTYDGSAATTVNIPSQPSTYLKSATSTANSITVTKQDDTTVGLEVQYDYALTNLTGIAVSLASGQIGNVTLDNTQTNLALSLDFSSNTNRSGDCMLLAFCGAETTLAVGPSQAVDILGTYEKLKAGTNLVMVTRMMMNGTNSVVMVNVREVK